MERFPANVLENMLSYASLLMDAWLWLKSVFMGKKLHRFLICC